MNDPNKPLRPETEQKLRELIEINVDSVKGFQRAQQAVEDPDLALRFRECARARNGFANELATFSPPSKESFHGSFLGRVHRWWLELRARVTKDEGPQVLREVVRGENALLDLYKEVLVDTAGSPVSDVLHRQIASIKHARDEFAQMAAA